MSASPAYGLAGENARLPFPQNSAHNGGGTKPMLSRFNITSRIILTLAFTTLVSPWVGATIAFDASSRTWSLQSGVVEYKLHWDGVHVYMKNFGPAGQPGPEITSERAGRERQGWGYDDIAGLAEGEGLGPGDLELIRHEVRHPRPDVDELILVFKHGRLPLEITARYTTWGSTGVLTRQLAVRNRGDRPLRLESLPSLAWVLPGGRYELTYLWGGGNHERQLASVRLGPDRRSFVSSSGRSTDVYSPWLCLKNEDLGIRYLAQLAYSGNWEMHFERRPYGQGWEAGNLRATLGMRFDFGGALQLAAGQSFTLPAVAFTATAGDLDDGVNQLHRYQRQYVIPRTSTNDPLLVQFNSWYPFPGKPTADQMKKCVDIVAQLGAEVFVHDAGWFNKKDWSRELGDWVVDPVAYPHGLEELAQYVHGKGLKFGLWIEIENLGVDSQTFREHPDWCLSYNGQPLRVNDRYHLNFAQPEVRQWARSVIDRLVRNYRLDWLKIDYNITIGEFFDPPATLDRRGDVLYRHLMNYYQWLDEVRSAYPKLVIESCASGGTRFDLGIMAHTHTTWLSDEVRPWPSVQLGYGCTVEFIPEVCNHWMVGDNYTGAVDLSNSPGWWDFLLRVPMNGQYGISSRVFDWSPALKEHAARNIALYKQIRPVIMGADVYHLTPPPDHDDPTGWCAIQYVSTDQERSVLTAYRLKQSRPDGVFRLRGLDPNRRYQVTGDGTRSTVVSGQELGEKGLAIELEDEGRATVVELRAE
jgi:alpha-galactosidase